MKMVVLVVNDRLDEIDQSMGTYGGRSINRCSGLPSPPFYLFPFYCLPLNPAWAKHSCFKFFIYGWVVLGKTTHFPPPSTNACVCSAKTLFLSNLCASVFSAVRYCNMLIEEGGLAKLHNIRDHVGAHPDVLRITIAILDNLEKHLTRHGNPLFQRPPPCKWPRSHPVRICLVYVEVCVLFVWNHSKTE